MDTRDHELHSEHVKNPEVAYDRTDLSPRGIAIFLIALAVAGILTHFVLWGAYRVLAKGQIEPTQPNPMVTSNKEVQQVGGDPSQVFPAPRLQPDPTADMAKFRASELQHLYSYGKAEGGATSIPINEAMDAIAKQGLPTRAQGSQVTQSQPPAAGEASQAQPGGTKPQGNSGIKPAAKPATSPSTAPPKTQQ
jgi:hypothetical protein